MNGTNTQPDTPANGHPIDFAARARAFTYIVMPSEIPGEWEAHCLDADIVGTSPDDDSSPTGAVHHATAMVAHALKCWAAEGTSMRPARDRFLSCTTRSTCACDSCCR